MGGSLIISLFGHFVRIMACLSVSHVSTLLHKMEKLNEKLILLTILLELFLLMHLFLPHFSLMHCKWPPIFITDCQAKSSLMHPLCNSFINRFPLTLIFVSLGVFVTPSLPPPPSIKCNLALHHVCF